MKLFLQQFYFFASDYKTLSGSKRIRMLYLWLNRVSVGLFFYRFDRGMYLMLGKYWSAIRILLYPFFMLIDIYSNLEISYKADIGPGINILHPSLGLVKSGYAKIGKNFGLVGGNIIGGRQNIKEASFIIGDNVSLGANAVILGPCNIANNTVIGACALVIKDTVEKSKMVGVPAENINNKESVNE